MRHLLLLLTMFLTVGFVQAQTMDELKSMKAEKMAAADALMAEANALQGQIDGFGGWTHSLLGNVGGNFSGFDNWFSNENINSTQNAIVLDVLGSLRYNDDKQFLYNDAIVGLGRLSSDLNTNVPGNQPASIAPNKLNISSLYGYKIIKNLALSANATYNTAILGNNAGGNSLFNNPGDLDLGVGVTWTPIDAFYLMVHPLNYHWKFGDNPDFVSGAGAKIKAGYNRELFPGLAWISALEAFFPYQDSGLRADGSEIPSASFYEWTNSFAFNLFKGIGVGVTYGIRQADSESSDVQMRYNVGLTYSL